MLVHFWLSVRSSGEAPSRLFRSASKPKPQESPWMFVTTFLCLEYYIISQNQVHCNVFWRAKLLEVSISIQVVLRSLRGVFFFRPSVFLPVFHQVAWRGHGHHDKFPKSALFRCGDRLGPLCSFLIILVCVQIWFISLIILDHPWKEYMISLCVIFFSSHVVNDYVVSSLNILLDWRTKPHGFSMPNWRAEPATFLTVFHQFLSWVLILFSPKWIHFLLVDGLKLHRTSRSKSPRHVVTGGPLGWRFMTHFRRKIFGEIRCSKQTPRVP